MRGFVIILVFVCGLGIGLSAPAFAPRVFDRYMPESLQAHSETIEGHVRRKQVEADRVLLTVSTPQGAILATFTLQQGEIDLLVDQGDTVTLSLRRYEPFVTDPKIQRVMKPDVDPAPHLPSSSVTPLEQTEPRPTPDEQSDLELLRSTE